MSVNRTLFSFLLFLTSLLCEAGDYVRLEGAVFHTSYHITYEGTCDYTDSIEGLFADVDNSLSMFNERSVLARVNSNDRKVRINDHVRNVMTKGWNVSADTDGAFDMTVGPLVNLWGFGFRKKKDVTQCMVDSVRRFVGYHSVRLDKHGRVRKKDRRTVLDASSIAKGYACDVVGRWLRSKGVTNYLVEIGGEIALMGVNPGGKPWTVAVNTPEEDSLSVNRHYQDVLRLTSGGVATSGNYRNFYYKDGIRYAHTIDPRTGYPASQDVLSATVVASDCMTADAYATAFMVLGLERSLAVLERHPDIHAYFILSPLPGSTAYRVVYSPSLRDSLSSLFERTAW